MEAEGDADLVNSAAHAIIRTLRDEAPTSERTMTSPHAAGRSVACGTLPHFEGSDEFTIESFSSDSEEEDQTSASDDETTSDRSSPDKTTSERRASPTRNNEGGDRAREGNFPGPLLRREILQSVAEEILVSLKRAAGRTGLIFLAKLCKRSDIFPGRSPTAVAVRLMVQARGFTKDTLKEINVAHLCGSFAVSDVEMESLRRTFEVRAILDLMKDSPQWRRARYVSVRRTRREESDSFDLEGERIPPLKHGPEEDSLLERDLIRSLRLSHITVEKVLKRAEIWSSSEPKLWELAVRHEYEDFFRAVYGACAIGKIDDLLLRRCLRLFPDDRLSSCLARFGRHFRIGFLGATELRYVLNVAPEIETSEKKLLETADRAVANLPAFFRRVEESGEREIAFEIERCESLIRPFHRSDLFWSPPHQDDAKLFAPLAGLLRRDRLVLHRRGEKSLEFASRESVSRSRPELTEDVTSGNSLAVSVAIEGDDLSLRLGCRSARELLRDILQPELSLQFALEMTSLKDGNNPAGNLLRLIRESRRELERCVAIRNERAREDSLSS